MQNTKETREVAGLFLKLGVIGFGGPAAHIALMREEVVVKRNWMTEERFLDLVGATNLIPGPNSTELAIHIGYERAGWKGLLLAGACFILPAVIITGIFAWLYKLYGQLPEVQPFVYGIKPAIIAIILGAVFPLARKSFKSFGLALIGVIVCVGSLLDVHELYLMFGAGFAAMLAASFRSGKTGSSSSFSAVLLLQASGKTLAAASNMKLFWIFLKVGSVLYGSGYALFAFLDTELVSTGLLTRPQLIDAIAVGQFTPGPVFSSVTFVGYQMNGISGAIVSTVAIFLPSFVFVALLNPLVKKMRGSRMFSAFLDAVNCASVAIIATVCYALGKEAITDWRTVLIAVLGILLAFGFRKVNSAFIVIGGSLLGYALSFL